MKDIQFWRGRKSLASPYIGCCVCADIQFWRSRKSLASSYIGCCVCADISCKSLASSYIGCYVCADIQFWRSRKSLEGLSVRSVFFNVFQSLIVLLYVMDNETNTIVKISIFVGLCIELWKINKVVNIQVSVCRWDWVHVWAEFTPTVNAYRGSQGPFGSFQVLGN